jgi:hypothetical protein
VTAKIIVVQNGALNNAGVALIEETSSGTSEKKILVGKTTGVVLEN